MTSKFNIISLITYHPCNSILTHLSLCTVAPLNAPTKDEPTANGGEKTPAVTEVDEYISDSPKR